MCESIKRMHHVKLAGVVAAVGFVFTSKPWLQWLNKFGPEAGLVIKNLIIVAIIFMIHSIDQGVNLPKVKNLGFFMIYMAFMMIFNYQSKWISDAGAPNVESQTPDGATYHRVQTIFNFSPELSRVITFVMIPFLLVFLGGQVAGTGRHVSLD